MSDATLVYYQARQRKRYSHVTKGEDKSSSGCLCWRIFWDMLLAAGQHTKTVAQSDRHNSDDITHT